MRPPWTRSLTANNITSIAYTNSTKTTDDVMSEKMDTLVNTTVSQIMKPIFANIGLALLICQKIEVLLGTILVTERSKGGKPLDHFVDSLAQVRLQVLETLKNEIAHLDTVYVNLDMLDTIIERRNWLVHRLYYDERFNSACDTDSPDDFLDVVALFGTFYRQTEKAYLARLKELGLNLAEAPNAELMESIRSKVLIKTKEKLQNRKKKKG